MNGRRGVVYAPDTTPGTPLRPVSPAGTVHEYSGRTTHGLLLTLCGLECGVGWGKTRQRPPRPIDCQRCVRAARRRDRPKTRRRGQPVAMAWGPDGVETVVAMGRDEDAQREHWGAA